MSALLFIDRDGTLIEEPSDQQVDELSKIRFMPGVFSALNRLSGHGFRFVMVSNQDGLGSPAFPEVSFSTCQNFIVDAFRSQGIEFDRILICPHRENDGCDCRKPKLGLVEGYLRKHAFDLKQSAVIGDRDSDAVFARNLGVRSFTVACRGSADQTWLSVARALTERVALLVRSTRETQIDVRVNLDNESPLHVHTGIGFFDHMLEQLAKHGGFSMELTARGDLQIDEHHTVEDSALVLGEALRQALGAKVGIARYGFLLPMDEAEASIAVDLSGRPFAQFSGQFARESVGSFPTELVPHFFRSLSEGLRAAIHVKVRGENTHHMIEACFKGVGRALRQAFRQEGQELPSTKGVL
jgi:imidazoleglycerol-phosphate dehydratase / histidinol-phosphatase